MKIELHKQFRVPIDGLTPIAEEIIIAKDKKKQQDKAGPYKVAEAEKEVDSESSDEDSKTAPADASAKDRKALKKEVKAEKREKRKLKKELKLAFKG